MLYCRRVQTFPCLLFAESSRSRQDLLFYVYIVLRYQCLLDHTGFIGAIASNPYYFSVLTPLTRSVYVNLLNVPSLSNECRVHRAVST